MAGIDLHSHTTASDGMLEPAALVSRAHAAGVRTLAVTDHDTIAGLGDARTQAERLGVELVPGIELSTVHGRRGLHVLGYLFEPESPSLAALIAGLVAARESRAERIAARLAELGRPVAMDDVRRLAEGGPIGRPHFARALVEAGHVGSTEGAFERWLGDGRPAHVVVEVLTAEAAIAGLHAAGGVAVLAHPLTYSRDPATVEGLIRVLAAAGLDGIEVFYGAYSQGEMAMLGCFAERYGLVATGGSDFHQEPGPPCPDVPPDVLERLHARAAPHRVQRARS